MIQTSPEENKGQYCRFVVNGDGNYELKPVKVPQFVIEERAAEIRQREYRERIERNRERSLAFNVHSIMFLAVALTICVFFCCCYLAVQSSVVHRLNTISSLEYELEDLIEENDLRAQRITAGVDLNTVQQIAEDDLGMSSASRDQIVYYSVDQQDYMLQYDDVDE